MKLQTLLVALLLIGCVTLDFSSAQDDDIDDDFDDEELDVEDELDEDEEAPEIKLPKKQKPVYTPPEAKGNVYFAEAFVSANTLDKRWVKSAAMKDGADEDIAKYDGEWSIEEPADNPLLNDLSLVLKSKAKHHAISAKLDKPFKFSGKPFIVQYEVKFQNALDCGGAYVKLLSEDARFHMEDFQDKTPYTIMFGPDKCGNDDKLHFIFRHKNPITGEFEEKNAKKPTGRALPTVFTDKKTHLFRLMINPDNTFRVFIDQDMVNSGSLLEDLHPPVNPVKEIDDENDKKPEDWDSREKIPDPDATKPEDWDEEAAEYITDPDAVMPEGWLEDIDELIPDPDAERPKDWDDSMDGEWEAPMISNTECESAPGCGEWMAPEIKNPLYKGKWKAPKIDNPSYQGKWSPQRIPNPNYFEDLEPYMMTSIGAVGLELWSMSNDIAFDNFIITDDVAVADRWGADTWELKQTQELIDTSGQSVLDAVTEMTNERPWLLAVIIFVVVLPCVILIAYCCSGSKKPDEAAERKKTDALTPDDAASGDKAESSSEEEDKKDSEADEDQSGEDEAGGGGDAKPKVSPKKSPKKSNKKPSKSDLEADDAEQADAEEDVAEEGEPEEPRAATRSSPRKRASRARKD